MHEKEAGDQLWGSRDERARHWEKFPNARRGAVLANVARPHIDGRASYLTSLLLAIDALSLRAIELKSRIPPPTTRHVATILHRQDPIPGLEELVARMAEFDELTMEEMVERMRLEIRPMLGGLNPGALVLDEIAPFTEADYAAALQRARERKPEQP